MHGVEWGKIQRIMYVASPHTQSKGLPITIVVDENALDGYGKELGDIRGLSKSKAKAVADDGVMTRAADAVIVLNNDTGEVVSFEMK